MLLLSKINFIGLLVHRVIAEELTTQYDDLGLKCERDAFDTLFDHAPDKLQVVNFIFHIEVSKSQDPYISNFLHNISHCVIESENLVYGTMNRNFLIIWRNFQIPKK